MDARTEIERAHQFCQRLVAAIHFGADEDEAHVRPFFRKDRSGPQESRVILLLMVTADQSDKQRVGRKAEFLADASPRLGGRLEERGIDAVWNHASAFGGKAELLVLGAADVRDEDDLRDATRHAGRQPDGEPGQRLFGGE